LIAGDATTLAVVVQKDKSQQGQNTYLDVGAKVAIWQGKQKKSLRPGKQLWFE
jgi:hypothetical protein